MTIFIPTPLRPYAGGQPSVEIQAATIAEALSSLTARIPSSKTICSPRKGNCGPLLTCI